MRIREKVSLAESSTMGIGGKARYFATCESEDDLLELINLAKSQNLEIHILGDGANTIFRDVGFEGLVIKIKIKKFELDKAGLLTAGAGENWDEVVEKSVDAGWSGIEALSYIPGTVGAAPVQNIGAYGQELSETFVSLRAYDLAKGKFIEMKYDDLKFGYRTSLLKQTPGYFIVTEIKLNLNKQWMRPPFYTTLQKYFDEHGISQYSPANIRKAVVNWRKNYLPDYKVYKTAGSFFTNPIVDKAKLDEIVNKNPAITDWSSKWFWELPNGKYKIAAGRLADNAGLKDLHDKDTGISTWKNSSIVLINEHAKSYSDLSKFRNNYQDKISELYGLNLDQEPVEV